MGWTCESATERKTTRKGTRWSQSSLLPLQLAGIQSLYHYQSQFCALVCVCVCVCVCVSTENDIYTVVGLNCSSIPISIAWEMALSSSAANVERQETSNSIYSRLVVLILHLS